MRDVKAFLWPYDKYQTDLGGGRGEKEEALAKQMAKDLALLRAGKKGLLSPQEASEYLRLTEIRKVLLRMLAVDPAERPAMEARWRKKLLSGETVEEEEEGRAEIVQQLSQDQVHGKEET